MRIEGGVSLNTILRCFRHGFRTLSHVNWVSASGFQVAALLGVVGLILAIRDGKAGDLSSLFSERTSRTEKLRLVPGLQNLGNNCFLNVILQALASCLYFQPFLQKVIEECELLEDEGQVAILPLTASLATLLEELCEVGGGRVVLSPRKLMMAMAHYIPNFNLTTQQDAAEAFLYLLSSLREEFSDCYLPNQCSLVDVSASSRRILIPKLREDWSEQERWQQHFLGPFDGILGSILTCQSCSSQISLSFESFHSLPLSPVFANGATIMVGCTLEDCLKQFIIAEHIENYHCSHCWHVAGIKYLSSIEANEILCIHLKRVSINMFGEPVKLQGHISFPLILDLYPFMTSGVGIRSWGENFQRKQVKLQSECTSNVQAVGGEINLAQTDGCSESTLTIMHRQSDDRVTVASETHLYRLVSVVEHFGRAGSGHYTVYRSVSSDLHKFVPDDQSEPASARWFCISDSDVQCVSEEEVLAAEASLLFYEKIVQG
ncbi:hypothetical protein I3843_03G127700 [Carya illinoinensis]|nr:hypothetical protein I3843_03G127700 [Carya illinoinensis]